MKTPAIIASLTVAGSIAFAAGQQSGGRQSPAIPSAAKAHSMQEEMPQARMAQMAGGCAEGEPLKWFTVVHDGRPADTCVGDGFGYWSEHLRHRMADVNQDGQLDGNFFPFNGSGEDPNEVIFGRVTFQLKNQAHPVIMQPLLRASTITQYLGSTSVAISPMGLVDMDNDGDLDLLVMIDDGAYTLWVENTGYEKPAPPIAADLNRDGQVDGADLGLLLYAWSPNP